MYSYLALGDSYTIGELVDLKQNFPFQLVKQLNNSLKIIDSTSSEWQILGNDAIIIVDFN